MRDQEIIGLYEAYQQVYAHQEEVEQLDESGLSLYTLRSARQRRFKTVDEIESSGGEDPEGRKKLRRTQRAIARKTAPGQPDDPHKGASARLNMEMVDGMYVSEAQEARNNPERYENSPEAIEGRRGRSGINDPHTGINSPAFRAFMAQQMGGKKKKKPANEQVETDLFDHILEHLVAEGYADTNEAALVIMANMSEEWRQSIIEGGFNSSGRYDVGDGRTVGPIAGAIRALLSGNLPGTRTYVPAPKQTGPNRPPAIPPSRDDSGRLTDFGAGGGRAKLKSGLTVGQVERQGRMNRGDYSG